MNYQNETYSGKVLIAVIYAILLGLIAASNLFALG
jgi:hypothetical protein